MANTYTALCCEVAAAVDELVAWPCEGHVARAGGAWCTGPQRTATRHNSHHGDTVLAVGRVVVRLCQHNRRWLIARGGGHSRELVDPVDSNSNHARHVGFPVKPINATLVGCYSALQSGHDRRGFASAGFSSKKGAHFP
jgi:hypothetical protein